MNGILYDIFLTIVTIVEQSMVPSNKQLPWLVMLEIAPIKVAITWGWFIIGFSAWYIYIYNLLVICRSTLHICSRFNLSSLNVYNMNDMYIPVNTMTHHIPLRM
jgi:hypothetical protein